MENIFPASNREDSPDNIPSGIPVELLDELGGREPTNNEMKLIGGEPIYLGSTNVRGIWWNWREKRLFVEFLDGSLYSYENVSFAVALGMIDTDSPGRYVWNVLRADGYAYRCLVKGTIKNPKPQVIRKH